MLHELKEIKVNEFSKCEETPYILQFINNKTGEVSEEFTFFTLDRAKQYYRDVKHLIKGTEPRYLFYDISINKVKEI